MASVNPRKALERARVLHRQGELAEAERLYQSVLRRDAGDVDALHGLGLLHVRRGDFEQARHFVDRALGLSPQRAELHFHRAEISAAVGMREQALEGYRDALTLDPDYFDVLINLSDLLLTMGRADEALAHLDRALRIRPQDPGALNNRGNALQALKRHAEALECFDRAREVLPENADVLSNRASALLSLGRVAQAEAECRGALASQPRHAYALLNLGRAQAARGAIADALKSYDAALAIQPADFDAWYERATLLSELQRFREVRESLERAVRLKADSVDAWSGLGTILLHLGQYGDALKAYDHALPLEQGNAGVWINRGLALHFLGHHAEAAAAYSRALEVDPGYPFAAGRVAWLRLCECDWTNGPSATQRILQGVRSSERIIEPFELFFFSDRSRDQLDCARVFARDYYPAAPDTLWRGERYRHDRIRVAYLSADFREHATSHLIAGLLEMHDRSRFETFGISFGPDEPGPMASRIASAFEHFTRARDLGDRQIADLLRQQEIDIAVDLMGYTTFGRPRIYALRPCPVHVNYLGYPGTMGTRFIDYMVADHYVVPMDQDAGHEERVVRLPDCFQANDVMRSPAPYAPSRSALRLPESVVVYCSMNKGSKLTADMFSLWMEILAAVRGSVLWLLGGTPAMQQRLQREAESRGVAASRLVFATRVAYADHLARLQQADVILDTLPFNGGATTSDALRSGVPVVTCAGEAFASRMSGSLLQALGMPDLIAPTLADYKSLAVRLGLDAEFRQATKRRLAANRLTQPLFDTDKFRGHLEAAYEVMWRRSQNGEPPASFSVER